MVHNKAFFEALKTHSEIKHRILAKFIPPWRAKLGSKTVARGGAKLWYVDAFAGTGRYGDGADGSPIIGARQALAARQENRDYSLGCINVELKRDRLKELIENTRPFQEEGVDVRNLQGEFSTNVAEIMEIIAPSDPILLFIDPFGIKPLIFESFRPLLQRPGEVDLILTFNSAALHRLVVDHPHLVTRAIGTDEWLKGWNIEGAEAVLEALDRQLQTVGRFMPMASYPVRTASDESAHYHLVVASRDYSAYELWNDSVCDEDARLTGFKRVLQPTLLVDWEKEQDQRELIELILQEVGLEATNRKAIRRHVVLNHWGEWHTTDINNAVNALVDAGRAKRDRKGAIDTDPLKFV